LITVFSEGNIVYHMSAKHNLAWCCLQCCVIVASRQIILPDKGSCDRSSMAR
jgi:hypothetical protein